MAYDNGNELDGFLDTIMSAGKTAVSAAGSQVPVLYQQYQQKEAASLLLKQQYAQRLQTLNAQEAKAKRLAAVKKKRRRAALAAKANAIARQKNLKPVVQKSGAMDFIEDNAVVIGLGISGIILLMRVLKK